MAAVGVVFSAFAVFAIAHGDEYQTNVYGMQGIRVFGDTAEKRDFVNKFDGLPGYDFLAFPRATDKPIEALVAPEHLEQFKNDLNQNDIKYEVFVEDVSKILEENLALQKRASITRVDNIFKSFPRYAEIIRYLKNIASQYSDIAETFSIGKSYEGRDLLGLKISTGGAGKPIAVIDAGIHAREWIAPTTALYTIHQLVTNSSNRYLFEDVDIYIIPSLNPDGYEYTHQNIVTRLWRKTRSNHSRNPRCRGTDANRNFDVSWMSTGASNDPCSEIYAGPKAFSEPEAIALRDFMLPLKGRVKSYITLHSYGQYFLHPWGFTRIPPKVAADLKCVAKAAATELYKHRGNSYTIGSTIEVLYAASGSSMDWAMAAAGAGISYTIELPGGGNGFAPPPREILPVGRETFDAIAIFIQYAKVGNRVC